MIEAWDLDEAIHVAKREDGVAPGPDDASLVIVTRLGEILWSGSSSPGGSLADA